MPQGGDLDLWRKRFDDVEIPIPVLFDTVPAQYLIIDTLRGCLDDKLSMWRTLCAFGVLIAV